MLDRKFFDKVKMNVIARYREAIFDLEGKGANAKDVNNKPYKSYSEGYAKVKQTGKLNEQATAFKSSTAPVLTQALANSFTFFGFTKNGFKFGTPQWGGKVKSLEKLGRPISTKAKPVPDSVIDYMMDEAKKHSGKELKKKFKSSTDTIRI